MSVNIQTSDGLVKIAGTPTIDTSFSNISKNPVQNNVITQKFEQIDSQIRTQNSNLCDYNLNNKCNSLYQGYANWWDGNIVENVDYIHTDYVSVNDGDLVTIKAFTAISSTFPALPELNPNQRITCYLLQLKQTIC